MSFDLRWYQKEAIFSVFDYYERGNAGNPIIAMPTGTGKSVVLAELVREIFFRDSRQRIMMLTHVKKLIVQNAEKLIEVWPNAPLGVYSAGLKSRDMAMPIVFGGVQSVAKAIKKAVSINQRHFGHRDVIFIDECHLLSPEDDTTYQYVIAELRKINPLLIVIGLTATHYRLKQGMLTDGNAIFTDVCYDITDINSWARLIAEGFLAPLVGKGNVTQINTDNVGMVGGEFNNRQLEEVCEDDKLIYDICKEMCEMAYDRNCWIVFAAGVVSCDKIAAMLQSMGINAVAVHSKKTEDFNDAAMIGFQRGLIRCLVSITKLTTGVDHPPIDFIGDCAPTCSPGRHVQKLGRGTRPSPYTYKSNCLVGDFAGNIRRNGPVNDPKKPRKPGEKGTGDAPVKICGCGVYNHASARYCGGVSKEDKVNYNPQLGCGLPFAFVTNIFATAASDEPMRGEDAIVKYFNVKRVIYNLHEKKDKAGNLLSPPSMKVSYFCEQQMFSEWVHFELNGQPKFRAHQWWSQRHAEAPPVTTYQALQHIAEFRVPKKIRVHVNKKFPEVLSYEF